MRAQDSLIVQDDTRDLPIVLSSLNPDNKSLSGLCGKALDAPLEVMVADVSGQSAQGV